MIKNRCNTITLIISVIVLNGLIGSPAANPALVPGEWYNISPPGTYLPNPAGPPFGCMDVRYLPDNPSVLYVTTDIQGLWKSADAGASWAKIGTSSLGDVPSPGIMQINPDNPRHMYLVGGVRGSSLGFWISTDGGDTWAKPASFIANANATTWDDLYWVAADPADFNHILLTYHSTWRDGSSPGITESTDGGNSWRNIPPPEQWGTGETIHFLTNSSTWLVGTQYDGYWRTTNSGSSWTKVSSQMMQHGGCGIFRTKSGVLYAGAQYQIMRSTNDGITWTLVGPSYPDGYYAIVSDGNYLYAQEANTGGNTGAFFGFGNPPGYMPYIVSPEDDGITWTPYNGGKQTFRDGPYSMVFDSLNGIIYSANWNSGVWALKALGATPVEKGSVRALTDAHAPATHLRLEGTSRQIILWHENTGKGWFDVRGRQLISRDGTKPMLLNN